MSIRVYHGPHSDRHDGPSPWIRRLPLIFAIATVLLQIAWPLANGSMRATLTIAIVCTFFLASLSHSWLNRGWGWTLAWAIISIGFGFVIELVGTSTGLPFSTYSYQPDTLGWTVSNVPVVIPLAWAMMSYPALLVGRRLASTGRGAVILAAWAFASWDLFLDPQMVGEGYWTWESPSPSLPGIPGIPIVNYLGWLLAAAVLMFLLNRLPDPDWRAPSAPATRRRTPEAVPGALYLWTWLGGIMANVFFLGRPAVGIIGGIAMGLVAIPYALRLTERAP